MAANTWRPFSILHRGPVPVPQWTSGLRGMQALFALIIISLLGYSLHYHGGGVLQAPLITQIFIAIVTLLIILPITTVLAPFQRQFYDPRAALVADWFACLFWLASTAALASYLDLSRASFAVVTDSGLFQGSWRVGGGMKAYNCGVAAAVFGGLEFALFAIQSLVFTYHYHLFLANEPPISATTVPYGIPPARATGKKMISAPTATDPAALEAGTLPAPRPAPTEPNYPSTHPAYQSSVAPPPPPVPHDSPVFGSGIGAGGGVGGGQKFVAGALPMPGTGMVQKERVAPYPVEGGVI